jgi:hypothetical protein
MRRGLMVGLLAMGCGAEAPSGDASSSDASSSSVSSTTSSSSESGSSTSSSGSTTTSSDTSSSSSEDDSTTSPQIDLGTQPPGTYYTDFPLDENPVSENGAWSAIASPWLRVRTIGGIAGPDEFVTRYNDNYAILSGFAPDVEITATVYISGSAPFGEILLLARMADTATTIRGYEFLYDGDGSVQLMRWNGPNSDFTPMGGEGNNPGPLQDFDQLRMCIEGDTITIFHRREPDDWVQIGQTTDGTFADGQPGMGFFVRNEGQTLDGVGLRDYQVEEI